MKTMKNLQNKYSLRSKNISYNEEKENYNILNKPKDKKIYNTNSKNIFNKYNIFNKRISPIANNPEKNNSDNTKFKNIELEFKSKKGRKIISPKKITIKKENIIINSQNSSYSFNSENYISQEKTEKKSSKKDTKEKNKREKLKATIFNYQEKGNKILIRNYGGDVYSTMQDYEESTVIPINFMQNHLISKEIRTKMIDWMIEVLSVYCCDTETFFLSVYIMDFFLYKTKDTLKSEHVHCIGLTSMFLASKYEDLNPLKMFSVANKIGHNIFSE